MSHNLESVVESQRYLEALMNKIALGSLIDLSFQEAMDVCHWMNRRVRPIGKEWYCKRWSLRALDVLWC